MLCNRRNRLESQSYYDKSRFDLIIIRNVFCFFFFFFFFYPSLEKRHLQCNRWKIIKDDEIKRCTFMMFQAPFVRLRFNYQTLAIRPILMTHVRSSVTPFYTLLLPSTTRNHPTIVCLKHSEVISMVVSSSLRFSPFFVYNRARRFTQIPTNYA